MATLGYTSVGASDDWFGADYLYVAGPYAAGSTFTAVKATGYRVGASADRVMRAIVYADSSGVPGALVAITDDVTIPNGAAGAWYDFTFDGTNGTGNFTINNGSSYWIGYWEQSGTTSGDSSHLKYDAWGDYPTHNLTYKAGSGFSTGPGVTGALDPYPTSGDGTTNDQLSLYITDGGSAPVNTVAPAVTGTPEQGFTLTVDPGTWT